jgi:hypothetical protein
LTYSERFSKYDRATSTQLRKTLDREGLAKYEIAKLCDLAPEDADEASKLIPSLKRFDDEKLDEVISEFNNIKYVLCAVRGVCAR